VYRFFRLAVIAAVIAATAAVAPQFARSADAASCVKIYEIYYNSPGSPDAGSNTSLNGEWVQLKNTCTTRKNLYGYKIVDLASHTYRFGSTFYLGAGSKVKIHTGKGTNTSTDRYWGSGWYIWNQDKDTAKLYNSSGTLIRTCSYSNASASYKIC
jgi:hypothetical protein